MKRKFCFVFIVLLSIFAFSSNLFAWFPQSIYLTVPGANGNDGQYFRAQNTQTYAWAMYGWYRNDDESCEGTAELNIWEGAETLVHNEIDVDDLPETGKDGDTYLDGGYVDFVFHTDYAAGLLVSSQSGSLANNNVVKIGSCLNIFLNNKSSLLI